MQEKNTPVMAALNRSSLDSVKVLVEDFGARLDLINDDNNTPLHLAAESHFRCMKFVRYIWDKCPPEHLEIRGRVGRAIGCECVGV